MNVLLLGAPGAGKGTQAVLLADRHGLARISTGDLLRAAVQEGTPLGLRAKAFMDAGELVPDDVILGLVREVLARERARGARGFVFDGFPRTVAQAEALDGLLAEAGESLDAVVVIEVPDDVLVRRLSGRRTCPQCGAVYNVYLEPPRVPGACDVCGGTLVERPDDDAATVRRRLEVYRAQTLPLVGYYERTGRPVRRVDGDRPVEEVYRAVEAALRT